MLFFQVRGTKRTCRRPDPISKWAIPRDDSIDEAMSGFEFLHLDNIKALQGKTNVQPVRKPSYGVDSQPKDKPGRPSMVKAVGGTGASATTLVPTSTPPQGSSYVGDGFAALEAADLSIIAPVPAAHFRFFGKAQRANPPPSFPASFTFRGGSNNDKHHDLGCSQDADMLASKPSASMRNPAFIPVSSMQDDVFANLLQNQLALNVAALADPSYTGPESQQTTTTEGQLASESEVDVLQPRQGRKRKVSKVRLTSGKTSYTSLKAKKRGSSDRTRSSIERIFTGIEKKGKSVSPSTAQSARGVLIGMRGTKGSLIRDTPAKAGPETSVDELGLA